MYQTTSPPGAVNVTDPVNMPPNCGQIDSVYSASCLDGTVSPGLPLTPGRSLSTVYWRSLFCVGVGGVVAVVVELIRAVRSVRSWRAGSGFSQCGWQDDQRFGRVVAIGRGASLLVKKS